MATRWSTVNGEADLPAVHALQDQFTITPLRVYQGGAAPVPGVPQSDPRVGADLLWWESFRVALAAFPPPPADAPFVALCAKFGLTAAESPYIRISATSPACRTRPTIRARAASLPTRFIGRSHGLAGPKS